MINTKEFMIETEGILSNDLIVVLESVPGGRRDDAPSRRWIMPLSAHDALHVGLSSARAFVEPLPREVLAAITLASKRSGSAGIADEEGEAKEEEEAMTILKDRLPARLVSALAPFQRRGVAFGIRNEGRVFIADEMGLGKSIQALAVAAAFVEDWPVLIVTPSSARYHWKSEVYQWLAPELVCPSHRMRHSGGEDVFVVDKTKAKNLPHKGKFKFMIASYNSISKIAELLKGYKFKTVIVDESHYLKNHKAGRTSSIGPIVKDSKRAILLSGTPALSRPIELFSQLHLLRADLWPDRKAFGQRYCRSGGRGWNKEYVGCSNSAELHALLLSTIMVRRLKSSVAMELPDKTRYLIPIEIEDTEREAQMLELLRVVKPSHGRISFDPNHFEGDQNELGFLRNAGSDELVSERPKNEVMSDEMRQLRKMSMMQLYDISGIAKAGVIMKHIKRFLEDPLSGKLVVFAHHKNVLDTLDRFLRNVELRHHTNEALKQETDLLDSNDLENSNSTDGDSDIDSLDLDGDFRPSKTNGDPNSAMTRTSSGSRGLERRDFLPTRHRGVEFIRIDGRTDSKLRFDYVTQFQTSGSCRVALLAITAAGVALTLTAASTVYFAELFWTPGSLLQAEDRVHRIGQIHTVKIFYFLGKNTCDELIWPLIRSKIRTLGTVLEGRADADFHRHAHKNNKNSKSPAAFASIDKDSQSSDEESFNQSSRSGIEGVLSSRLSTGAGRQTILPFKPLQGTAGGKRAAGVVFPSQSQRKRRMCVVSDESGDEISKSDGDCSMRLDGRGHNNEAAIIVSNRDRGKTRLVQTGIGSDSDDTESHTKGEAEGSRSIGAGGDFEVGLFDASDLLDLEGVVGELAQEEEARVQMVPPGEVDEGDEEGEGALGGHDDIAGPRCITDDMKSRTPSHITTQVYKPSGTSSSHRRCPLRPSTPTSCASVAANSDAAVASLANAGNRPKRREDVEIIVIDSSDFESDADNEEEEGGMDQLDGDDDDSSDNGGILDVYTSPFSSLLHESFSSAAASVSAAISSEAPETEDVSSPNILLNKEDVVVGGTLPEKGSASTDISTQNSTVKEPGIASVNDPADCAALQALEEGQCGDQREYQHEEAATDTDDDLR
jgi:hypothetical protein